MLLGYTSCRDWDDSAGYWSPTAYVGGVQVTPIRQRIYYFGNAKGSVATVPNDLRIIAGNKLAASPGDNPQVAWNCGGQTPLSTHPYDCRPYQGTSTNVDGVVGNVDFPECWDGEHLDSSDHMSHMTYKVQGEPCAASHPTLVPRLRLRVHYGVWDLCLGTTPCGPTDPEVA